MDSDSALHNARVEMLRARSHLDKYASNTTPNSEEFERLFKEVQATTQEYVRLVKRKYKEKYSKVDSHTESKP